MNKISQIFLGGTCNNSQWREKIKPLLKKSWFDPVVKDWTPECQAEEIRQRENCDYCLYVLTPRMTGTYAVAEVVDDSNKRPEKTVFVPLRIDEELTFDDKQWKSMQAVAEMVKRNGGQVFTTLAEVAEFINRQ